MKLERWMVVSTGVWLTLVFNLMSLAAAKGTGSNRDNLPPAQAKAFWTYIHKINPYKNWQMWPGKHGLYPGRSPHGAFLKLYVNKIAYTAAKTHRPMPGGAILVKENYAKDKTTLLSITPMHKTDQYNPSAGNWFWAKYGPEGKVMETGKIQRCIDCHRTPRTLSSLLHTESPATDVAEKSSQRLFQFSRRGERRWSTAKGLEFSNPNASMLQQTE